MSALSDTSTVLAETLPVPKVSVTSLFNLPDIGEGQLTLEPDDLTVTVAGGRPPVVDAVTVHPAPAVLDEAWRFSPVG